jgi:6-pyruvoyltetrahydropterin/6-carboxytetrahydropterin synthase
MDVVFITRKERFNAAHRLFRPEFSDAENLRVFGKCSNPNWHGHNYVLSVTVKGPVNPETGFVANLKALSDIINDRVINKIDHRNINLEVDFMSGKLASAENLAVSFWQVLDEPVRQLGARLHCIRVEETDNNMVEYFGPEVS